MNEEQLLACNTPHGMLKLLRPCRRWRRKLFLYVCASCRCQRLWDDGPEPTRNLLGVAERSADGLAGWEEYKAARQAVRNMVRRDSRADPEAWSSHPGKALLEFFGLGHLPG